MRFLFFSLLFIICSGYLNAQTLSKKDSVKFHNATQVLKEYSNQFNNDSLKFEKRVEAIHQFIPRFVAILKEPNSFLYSFDSLRTLEIVTAPDKAFKIFTWQLKEPLGTHKYYGAMQMNSEKLELIPLFDYSDTMIYQTDSILSADNWYGGLYYNCLLNETENGKIYTLLGFDEADFVSKRKFIEILTFDEENKPVFGAPIIEFRDSTNQLLDVRNRFFIEFVDKAQVRLNFNEEKNMIVYDHVVPPSDAQKGAQFTYIPDGTYEGFEFKNGKWNWVEKIFHYSIGKPDSPPMPHPKFDGGEKKNLFGD